jgi:hypothetical protein
LEEGHLWARAGVGYHSVILPGVPRYTRYGMVPTAEFFCSNEPSKRPRTPPKSMVMVSGAGAGVVLHLGFFCELYSMYLVIRSGEWWGKLPRLVGCQWLGLGQEKCWQH